MSSNLKLIELETGLLPLRFRPLEKDRFDLCQKTINSGNFWFWTTRSASGFEATPQYGLGVWALHIPQTGRYSRYNSLSEYHAEPGSAVLLPFDDMVRSSGSADFFNISCTFDDRMVEACLTALGDERSAQSLVFLPKASMSSEGLRALGAVVALLARHFQEPIRPSDLMVPLLSELVICHVLSSWPQVQPNIEKPAARAGLKAAHLARDFIEAHLSSPLTVGDIARAAHVSIRSLQAAFREQFDTTPIKYLMERRLDCVRDELEAQAAVSVSQAAYRWGFTHMSDFGRHYRARFGCKPSETYRNAKRAR